MGNWLKKFNKNKGAVTIEATISLTAFLFMFIMLYSIINICRAQATIQVAINATAKELSQYSYLYSITGLHDSMKNVAEGAEGTKQDVNEVAKNVSQVFSGIQTIKEGGEGIDFGDVDTITTQWQTIMDGLEEAEGGVKEAQKTLTKMLEPGENGEGTYKLIFGMAKMMVSEGYEQAKSLAAEAISRVMVQKHLKRSNTETAESFCRSVGIQPGTYLFKESYFNGIDFSHSSLLPYKSNTITIVANYKMKLIQLIPVDIMFHFTQTAVTLAWVQGDVEIPDTPQAIVNQLSGSVWNDMSAGERESLIRQMGMKELTDDGFYGVSGHDYVHGYSTKDTGTLAVVRSYNPLAGLTSVDAVNIVDIANRLEKISSQVESSTANIKSVRIKKIGANGSITTEEKDCSTAAKRKVILVIPEDAGLVAKFEEALKSVETDVDFEFLPGYGKVFETETKEEVGG